MSHAFDTLTRALNEHVVPLLNKDKKPELALLIGMLVDEMHSANHRVPSADGVFSGDGVNKDRDVGRAARELDEHLKELERKKLEAERPPVGHSCSSDGCPPPPAGCRYLAKPE